MKRLLAALTLIATIANAQLGPPLVHEIATDFQQLQELDDMGLQQGANVEYRVRLRVGGRWFPLAGLTAEWQARENVTDQQALVAASVETVTNVTPNYFRFLLNADQTGSAVTDWSYSIVAKDGANVYPLGEGRLDVRESAWSGSPSVLMAGTINWAQVPGYTNTLTHGPYRFSEITFDTEINADGSVLVTGIGAVPDLVTDNTLHGLGTLVSPLGVVSNIVAGAELGSTALQSGDNVSELVNDAGYVTGTPWTGEGYLTNEVDTLQSVTARGATTTDIITVSDVVAGGASLQGAAQRGADNSFLGINTFRPPANSNYDMSFRAMQSIGSSPGITIAELVFESPVFGVQSRYGGQYIGYTDDRVIGLIDNTLYFSRGIWRSEGTATNTTQIVNFDTLTSNLAAYVQTNAIGTMAAQDTTNYYTIAETDAEILSPTITPTTTSASINISDLTEYYNVAPAGPVTVTLSPALTGQAQFLYLEYGAQNIEFPGNTTLGHFAWDEGFGDGPSAAAGVAGFYSTSYSTNWLGRWREF
jgi:hypothetical protein